MAKLQTPRERWIQEGWRALAAGGPDAVRIEAIAASIGVTKGGFYWHFADRQAFLAELIEAWERAVTDDVIDRVETAGGDARARLRELFGIAIAAPELLSLDLAIRDWARRDSSVAVALKRVDNRRMDYLRTLFGDVYADPDEVEARSHLVFALYVGGHYVAADHGGRTREEVDAATLELLLR
ncbi:MAG TPA: TetR/AcrR family transcriptional regulator [Jiangellaceae bacterium]